VNLSGPPAHRLFLLVRRSRAAALSENKITVSRKREPSVILFCPPLTDQPPVPTERSKKRFSGKHAGRGVLPMPVFCLVVARLCVLRGEEVVFVPGEHYGPSEGLKTQR
jgi:hypothetical protein